ncbi:hypothetical protein [Winogradskya humida]|uniref:DUF3558 domain-containing protein n=1 Tax=Winogradskya humida TaxID=113566 RepID=A0ABQ4A307_9ACTN|nr:hypothetical protein [Actinoplanes humidus]GIE24727.1 hypothetical protein Ahu01nite_078290 [Actinoplanes humidus]
MTPFTVRTAAPFFALVFLSGGCTSSSPVAKPAPSVAPSPSSSPEPSLQPVEQTCTDVIALMATATDAPWKLSQGPADRAEPGIHQCSGEASSTASTPPALIQVTYLLRRPGTDTPASMLDQVKRRTGDCTTDLPSPPDGAGYATSCVNQQGSSTTTLLFEAGWISVQVSAQGSSVSAFASKTSQKAAISGLSLI